MTAIGKMLVFLVLVLSLIWNFLVLNSYAARTNWQKEAKKYQQEAVAAADAANKMKALRDSEAESFEDAKRALMQERDRYYTQVAQLQASNEKLSVLYNTAFTEEQKKGSAAALLQASIDKLQGQVKELDDQNKKNDEKIVQLVLSANASRADKERASIEAAAYKKASEENTLKAQALREEINELKLGGNNGIPGLRTPVAPAGFRATVMQVDYSGGIYRIRFNQGFDAGLKQGSVLKVQRIAADGKYLGKLTVNLTDPKEAVGTFEPAVKGAVLTADSKPKVGDEVVPY
jgi:hypothetical protein